MEKVNRPINELKKIRMEKLDRIRKLGINPYPSVVPSRIEISKAREKKLSSKVGVVGRIMGFRSHGRIRFADLKDESADIQVVFKQDVVSRKLWEFLDLLDRGDFIYVSGQLFRTKAGELSVLVKDLKLLSKSLRPIPDEWYGLKDEEERFRQRYIDLLLNDELKDMFRKKSLFWNSIRKFLVGKGFLEVETPVLETIAGGADAEPFKTHHNALDIDVYLRISMGELWQKRLMVAGFEKTFEIGRQFRNEGISKEHLQDYTQMEFYWAYANYEDSMNLVEEMYKRVAREVFGKVEFEINGFNIDLGKRWGRIDYSKTLYEKLNIDILTSSSRELKAKLKELEIPLPKVESRGRLIDLLWKRIRKQIGGPVFLVGHPVEVSPLAKRMENNPALVERYQVIIAGSEVGNGYSELNDPIDQKERFIKQQQIRDMGDKEAHMFDRDFIRALEYGMPPVTGFGVSERLFSVLVGKPIRETVLFPLLRPEKL